MYGRQLGNTKKELTYADAFKKYQNENPNDKATDLATFSDWLKYDSGARKKYISGHNVEPITSLEKYKQNIAKKSAENKGNAAGTAVDATAQTIAGKDEKNKRNSIAGTVMGTLESVRNSFVSRKKSITANIAVTATNAQLTNNMADDDLQKEQFSFADKQESNNIDSKILLSLKTAITERNLPKVEQLLEQINVNISSINVALYNDEPLPLLHLSIKVGRADIVHAILEHDVNLPSNVVQDKSLESNIFDGAINLAQDLYNENSEHIERAKILSLLRVSKSWQEIEGNLNINKLIPMIEKIYFSIEDARWHEKVLFLGVTGAGKSALLNYLTGTQYDPVEINGIQSIKEKNNEFFYVDKERKMVSDTLYPRVKYEDRLSLAYCDLAGMYDTRGNEERICAANGLRLLSNLPGKIKGIVVVVDQASLASKRGEAFKETMIALARIMNGNENIFDNVIFVITQPQVILNNTANGQTVRYITADGVAQYLNTVCEDYKKNEQKLDIEDALLFKILTTMKDRKNQIFVSNIFDAGQSRLDIESALRKLKAIDSKEFNFSDYGVTEKSFENVLSRIVQWYLECDDKCYKSLPDQIEQEVATQSKTNATIKNLESIIITKESQMANAFEYGRANSQNTDNLTQEINRKEATKKNNVAEMVGISEEIKKLEKELDELNTSELMPAESIKRESLQELYARNPVRAFFGTLFLQKPRKETILYDCKYPIAKIDYNIKFEGKLERVLKKPVPRVINYDQSIVLDGDLTKYDLYEESFSADRGIKEIEVTFHTLKKYIYKKEIKKLSNKIDQKKQQNKEYEDENAILDIEISDAMRQQKINITTIEKRNESLKKQIEQHSDAILAEEHKLLISQQKQRHFENERFVVQMELQSNRELLQTIYKIIEDSNFTSHDFVHFCEVYKMTRLFDDVDISKLKSNIFVDDDESKIKYADSIAKIALDKIITFEAAYNKDKTGNEEFKTEMRARIKTFKNELTELQREVKKLNLAVIALKKQVAKNGEYETICTALRLRGHDNAVVFVEKLVRFIESEHIIANNLKTKKFKIEDGRNGLILNAVGLLVNILLPVPGLSEIFSMGQNLSSQITANKMAYNAQNMVNATGSLSEAKELAIKIAIAILQYHGEFIAKCSKENAGIIADAYCKAFKKYIETNSTGGQRDIFVNDVVAAMLGEYGIEELRKKPLSSLFKGTDFTVFANSKIREEKKGSQWLSEILKNYGEIDSYDNAEFLESSVSTASSKQNSSNVRTTMGRIFSYALDTNNYQTSSGTSSANNSASKKNTKNGASVTKTQTSSNGMFYSLPNFSGMVPNIYNLANNAAKPFLHGFNVQQNIAKGLNQIANAGAMNFVDQLEKFAIDRCSIDGTFRLR